MTGPRVLTTRTLLEAFRELGVEEGATLLVHSSLSSLGWVDGGDQAVIDALLRAVGRSGLLAMPTHTWATVHREQPVFHETLSASTVGRITESFRRRPGVRRSLHPTHSVAASGAGADDLVSGHERYATPCPPPSPYGQVVQRGGKVLLIGVGLDRCTLIHGFEEWADVPWLFNRTESLSVVTSHGEVLSVPSRRHTNDPYYEERDFPSLEPLFQEAGAIVYGQAGPAVLRLVDAAVAAAHLVPIISRHPDIVLGPRAQERDTPGTTAPAGATPGPDGQARAPVAPTSKG